jgi:hypothetical protein
MGFARLMSRPYGRILRIVAGVALIGVGFYVEGIWGLILGVVGAVPLLAGVFDVCIFAPLFGAPFSGSKARALV